MTKTFILAASAAFFIQAAPALAQSEADFVAAFSGTWQTLDQSFTDGGACRLQLRSQSVESGFGLTASRCGGTLANLDHWAIVNNQLALVNEGGEIVARLGGNQQRINGDTPGGPVVFDRVVESTSAAGGSAAQNSPCVYYGYTASCAEAADLALPEIASQSDGVQAGVLVALNARAEARGDADIVATIPAGTCVRVDECRTEAGDNWCRAQVANFSGWIKQQATRMDRWRVLTFTGQCNTRQ